MRNTRRLTRGRRDGDAANRMLRKLLKLFRSDHGDSGAFAERLAADWLHRERSFAVVARNWRNPRDERQEIDLVCRDGNVLVFVEVKARVADALVPGYFAVDQRKKRALLRAYKSYLARLQPKPLTFRFDVVEVAIPRTHRVRGGSNQVENNPGDQPVVQHYENVPLFSKHYRG